MVKKFLVFNYDDQGLIGAVSQYFTVDEKPRLNRRNSYFEDNFKVSSKLANQFWISATIVTLILLILSVVMCL